MSAIANLETKKIAMIKRENGTFVQTPFGVNISSYYQSDHVDCFDFELTVDELQQVLLMCNSYEKVRKSDANRTADEHKQGN